MVRLEELGLHASLSG